jgi:predicted nucleotidyltransferase
MYRILNDKPLNPVTLVVLRTLQKIAEKFRADYFVIGATARDILMSHVFGIDVGRATRDVDFAIALEDWHQFDAIKNELMVLGDFQPAAGQSHRLYYRQNEHGIAYPLDLIPFGRIERPGNFIAWPPDMDVVMNVAGYAEALRTAVQVDVGDSIVVNVVAIPALAALKRLAWNDRGLQDNKDAQDFYFLLSNYHQAGNIDRLYDEASSVLESNNYELELSGAALLGYDTSLIFEKSTRQALLDVLADPAKRNRLVIHMDRPTAATAALMLSFVEQFERGMHLPSLQHVS